MDNTLLKKIEILNQCNFIIEKITANKCYVGFNRLCETLRIRLEGLGLAVNISRQDYLIFKKSIKKTLTETKSLTKTASLKSVKNDVENLVSLVNNLLLLTDTEFGLNKKNNTENTL